MTLLQIEDELEDVKGQQSDEWKVIFDECGATDQEKSLLKDEIQLFIM